MRRSMRHAVALALGASLATLPMLCASADEAQVERGKYLVTIATCTDCHTRGSFFGKPDMAYFLAGSDVGFQIPGLGTFVGRNLTPDKETGLGDWTTDQILTALQKGVRPDGRQLAPVMPWHAYAKLSREDALAIVAYLRSLPPVKNEIPVPFGPNEKPTIPVMKVVMPEPAK